MREIEVDQQDLLDKFEDYLDEVERGCVIIIVKDGARVAVLMPVEYYDELVRYRDADITGQVTT